VFTITLDKSVDADVTLEVDTLVGTATAGTDYTTLTNVPVTFTAGSAAGATQTVTVSVAGDTLVEPDETFQVQLNPLASGRNVQFTGGGMPLTATGTILNDDVATLSVGDAMNGEEAGTLVFAVTLNGDIAQAVTVQASTALLTADAEDLTAVVNQLVTFTAGSTAGSTQMVTVTLANDTIVEADETFEVRLSNATYGGVSDPSRVTIGDGTGLGTIVNNDTAALSIGNVSQVETDSGTTNFVFTVTLNNAVEGGFTVSASTSAPGVGADFVFGSGTLTFQGTAGEQKTFTVQVNGDTLVEANEDYTLALNNL
jgi:hypothetical protein